jgi:hypothetical protein
MDIEMEEAAAALMGGPCLESSKALAALVGKPGPEALAIKGSSATDMDDADFVYNRTRLCKYKAHHQFKDDYRGRLVAMERGLVVTDFNECALRIRVVLKA